LIRVRAALLGGAAFFLLWFIGAQVLFFASGGGVNGETVPSADQYPAAVLSNQSGVHVGATLLVLAAVGLIWFAGGLRARIGSRHQLDLVPVIAISGVVILLILQAGLTVASLDFAEQAPDTSWNLYELSGALGFESFMTSLLGGMALAALVVTADRSSVSIWFWWFTVAFAVILTVGGLLEGVGVTPDGRFSILFGLWAFVAAFALQAGSAEDASN
jgi:hypothetical protein